MQHYLCQIDPKAPSNNLSHREFQMAFQHWIAYIRPVDCGHRSDATAKEHLMCPLLWCRETFDNLASTLHHVSECPWLSNTWYWCPYCGRPESFMAYEEPRAETMQYKLQRKDSKLRRAVMFFKHLGLKSCSRHKSSGSSTLKSSDTWLASGERFEMEDTSHDDDLSPKELADNMMVTPGHRLDPKKQSKPIYEMEGTMLYSPRDLDDLPRYSRGASPVVEPCELDVGNITMARQSNGTTGSSHGFLTGIGAQFEVTQLSPEPWKETLVSPISAIQSRFTCQSAGTNTSCHTQCGIITPTSSNSGPALSHAINQPDWGQAKVSPILNGLLLSPRSEGGRNHGVTSSTQSRVEELRETVRILNEEWIRRCHSAPELVLRASALSPRSIFATGVRTLQQVFRGVLPRTFETVYALAHIACASAYIMHGDDTLHCWNEFFQDILNWQHLMISHSDAQIFIQLINLLWWPQGSSSKFSCGGYFLDQTSGSLVPLRRPAVGFDAASSTGANDSRTPPESPTSMSLMTSLKTGVVLRECSRFLDGKPTHQHPLIVTWPDFVLVGIEYSGIVERSKQYPTQSPWYAQNHVTNIEEMLKTIIHPLQSCDGIEALRKSIDFVAAELQNGSLRSVREVEVSLISNGKVSTNTHHSDTY